MHVVILSRGSAVRDLLPKATTVQLWILNAFLRRKEDVKKSMANASSWITLSFDASTTLNDKNLIAIVAHYLDERRKLRTVLLALRESRFHDGDLVAPIIMAVIKEYGIQDKVIAFQSDNHGVNDTCIEVLVEQLGLNKEESRLRCQGYVLNLVVTALLYGKGVSAFQKQLVEAADHKVSELWREKGAIGRLHNIVTYITRSPQRIVAFNDCQKNDLDELKSQFLRLKRDTGIRWNSVFTMIQRALALMTALKRYCHDWQRPKEKDAYDLSQDFLLREH